MKKTVVFLTLIALLIFSASALSACDLSEMDLSSITQKFGLPEIHVECIHEYEEVAIAKEATCAEEGIKTLRCKRCDAFTTETIPVVDHTWSTEYTVDTDPTCAKEGEKSLHCTVCDAVKEDSKLAIPTSSHTFFAKGIVTPAACESAGVRKMECIDCGTAKEEAIPPLGHSFSDEWTVDAAPDCLHAGSQSHHCTRIGCDEKTDMEEIPAKGHTPGDWIFDSHSDCTAVGSKHKECTVCRTVLETAEIPASAHQLGEWIEAVSPTCTEKGTQKKSCLTCSYFETREVEALGHNFSTLWSVDLKETCLLAGSKSHHCQRSGCSEKTDVTEIAPLGHAFTNYVSDGNATCLVDGTKTAKCDRCTVTDTLPDTGSVLGHAFTNYLSDGNATCLLDGTKTAKCDRCTATDTKTDPDTKLGHNWQWVVDTPATKTSTGEKHEACTRCTAVRNERTVLPILVCDHQNAVRTPAAFATCILSGKAAYSYCADCQKYFEDEACQIQITSEIADYGVVAPLNHAFTNYASDGNATCLADGTKTAHCDRTGCIETDTLTDIGSALGHSFKNYVSNGDATCTADGTKTANCDHAGCTEKDTLKDPGSALGHAFENYVSDGNATCLVDGTKTAHCDHAGCTVSDTVKDEDSALGHEFTNYVSDGNATCTADGTKTAKCDRCPVKDTVVDLGTVLGHSFKNYVSNGDATCTADGTKTANCDHAGCTEKDTLTDTGSVLGHVFTSYVSDGNATCLVDGTKTAHCDHTGCTVTDTVSDENSALGHNWQWVVDTPATKTSTGEKHEACTRCTAVRNEHTVLPILNCDHQNAAKTPAVGASCLTPGKAEYYYCSECLKYFEDAACQIQITSDIDDYGVVAPLGHAFTNYVSNGDATCTADGTKTAQCDRCTATDTKADIGSALGHSFKNYVSNGDATCTADGTKTANCDHAGCTEKDTLKDPGSALGHAFENYVSDGNATCLVDGTKTAHCDHTGCTVSDTVKDEDSALGHEFTNYVSDGNATCTADGTKTAKCDRCTATDTLTDTGSKLAHTYDRQVTTVTYLKSAATCTDKAVYYYSCECGEKGTETFTYGSALGHSFTNYVSNGDATCTADGTKTAKCDRCTVTDTQTDTGSKLAHTYDRQVTNTTYLKSAATCTGKAVYYYSCECGEKGTATFASGSALGHAFTNYTSDGNASCISDGTKTAKCDRCTATDTLSDTGSALGHAFTNYVSDGNASCLVDGTKTAKCDRCTVTDTKTDTGSALGHSFTNYVSNGDATCTADGTKTAKCDRCTVTDTKTDTGSKLAHTYDRQVTTATYLKSAATCTDKAVYYYSCVCGEKGTATFASGSALGHSFTNYVSNGDATCTADGTKTAKCDRCTVTDTVTDTGSKLAHTYDRQVTTATYLKSAATCTDKAVYYYSCVCGEKGTATFASGSALGHSFTNYVYQNNATCTANGTKKAKCDRCSVTDTVTAQNTALGHSYESYAVSDLTEIFGFRTAGSMTDNANVTFNSTGTKNTGSKTTVLTSGMSSTVLRLIGNGSGTPASGRDVVSYDLTGAESGRFYVLTASIKTQNYENDATTGAISPYIFRLVKGETSYGLFETVRSYDTGLNGNKLFTSQDGILLATITKTAFVDVTAILDTEENKGYFYVNGVLAACETYAAKYLPDSFDEVEIYVGSVANKSAYDINNFSFYTGDVNAASLNAVFASNNGTATVLTAFEGEYTVDYLPDCVNAGAKSVYCTRCGAKKADSTVAIPSLGHVFGAYSVTVAGDCTTPKQEERTCTRPGCSVKDAVKYTAAPGHTWTTVVDTPATCGTNGTQHQECSVCHAVNPDFTDTSIPSVGQHNYVLKVSECVAPSCTVAGQNVSYCSVCQSKKTEDLAVLGHDFEPHKANDLTKLVGASTAEEWTALDGCFTNVADSTKTYASFSSENDYYKVFSDRSGGSGSTFLSVDLPSPDSQTKQITLSVSLNIAAAANEGSVDPIVFGFADHLGNKVGLLGIIRASGNLVEWANDTVLATKASYTGSWVDVTLVVDIETKTVTYYVNGCLVPDATHVYSALPDTADDYGSLKGYLGGSSTPSTVYIDNLAVYAGDANHLSLNAVLTANQKASALTLLENPHFTVDSPATCTADGQKSVHCSRCSEKTSVTVLPALGHTWQTIVDTPVTCLANGAQHQECSVCHANNASFTDTVILSVGQHNYVLKANESTAPTCTETGRNVYYCSACNDKKTDVLPALGHDYEIYEADALSEIYHITNWTGTITGVSFNTDSSKGGTNSTATYTTKYEEYLEMKGRYDANLSAAARFDIVTLDTSTVPASDYYVITASFKLETTGKNNETAIRGYYPGDYDTLLTIVRNDGTIKTCWTGTGSDERQEVIGALVVGEWTDIMIVLDAQHDKAIYYINGTKVVTLDYNVKDTYSAIKLGRGTTATGGIIDADNLSFYAGEANHVALDAVLAANHASDTVLQPLPHSDDEYTVDDGGTTQSVYCTRSGCTSHIATKPVE